MAKLWCISKIWPIALYLSLLFLAWIYETEQWCHLLANLQEHNLIKVKWLTLRTGQKAIKHLVTMPLPLAWNTAAWSEPWDGEWSFMFFSHISIFTHFTYNLTSNSTFTNLPFQTEEWNLFAKEAPAFSLNSAALRETSHTQKDLNTTGDPRMEQPR